MTKKIKLELGVANDFDDDKRVRLLGVIDRIRELGVSENVSLPQVRVLHQSSDLFAHNIPSWLWLAINRVESLLSWKD